MIEAADVVRSVDGNREGSGTTPGKNFGVSFGEASVKVEEDDRGVEEPVRDIDIGVSKVARSKVFKKVETGCRLMNVANSRASRHPTVESRTPGTKPRSDHRVRTGVGPQCEL